jgi:YVTN family beta-propeller protein
MGALIPAATGVFGNTAAGPHPATAHKGAAGPHHEAARVGTAYVINSGGGTVTPIDLATNTPGKPITLSEPPEAIAIAPDGTTAYVANQPSSTVTPIDLATGKPGKPIEIGHGWDSGFEAIAIVP